MGDYPKKEIKDIEEETNRIKKEAERRTAELHSKIAGGKIENYDLIRKRKIIESIDARISSNVDRILVVLKTFVDSKNKEIKFLRDNCNHNFNIYLSIKKDLSHTFKDNPKIVELFPDLKLTESENFLDLFRSFMNIVHQQSDLRNYLKRFL
ncbi:MAG TPA: hypothetical protein VJA20_00825 [Candidatus Nanoarchaeia archaeon]|nr:hypothetical protein [Candidatus Nanoarchaeia archaeon]